MRWLRKDSAQKLLDFVLKNPHSSFYKNKYKKAGIALKGISVKDFFSLPLLTREELESTPVGERTFVPSRAVRFAAFTSGTSSKRPLIIPFAAVDTYYLEPSLGLPVSRPLIIHPPMMKSFAHTFIQQCMQAKRPLEVLFGDVQSPQNSALLAAEFKCDSVFGIPTTVAQLGPHAKARGIEKNILMIGMSSESLTVARRHELKSMFPRAALANFYGSTELGQFVFFQCPFILKQEKNRFHVLADALVAVELIDGELVVSYGLNRATPLIRYRTGDHFIEVEGGCRCELPGPVLEWSHRSSIDRLRLNGVQFDIEESDRAFLRLGHDRTPEYQVHFYPARAAAISLRVEVVNTFLASAQGGGREYAKRLAKELPDEWRVSPSATIRTALERGFIEDFTVEVVREVSSPGLKAKRFINHVA